MTMNVSGELVEPLGSVGARSVTRAARSWVADMRIGADPLAPEGFSTVADAAEYALDVEGPWGLVDAGRACGGRARRGRRARHC
jgi:hypothetical protein